jgi:hypothetical protein
VVAFGPSSIPGASRRGPSGQVDYRLARDAVVREYRRGRLSRVDVCDAHPELLRAARGVGAPTAIDCPICGEAKVVLVSYAFGARLPAGGRCVRSRAELARLVAGSSEVACYIVEVCPECSWNHLAKLQLLGGRRGV